MRSRSITIICAVLALVAVPAAVAQQPSSLPKEVMVLELKPGQIMVFNAKDIDKEGRFLTPVPGHPNLLVVTKEKRLDDWARANAVYVGAQGPYEKQSATAGAVRKGDYAGATAFNLSEKASVQVGVNLNLNTYGGNTEVLATMPQVVSNIDYWAKVARGEVPDPRKK